MFGFSVYLLAGVGAVALVALWLFIAMLFRVVVPTNEVHIVQSKSKTVSYGKDQAAGNSYYRWPSWIPRFGITTVSMPMSVFSVKLDGYAAYDKGRLPFIIDVMAFFRISDTNLAAQRVSNFTELRAQLEGILQGACRTILATNEIEQILEGRSQFGKQFTDEVDGNLAQWGVQTVKQIELMDIRDAQNSKVIANIMAKKSSEIDRQSRVTVAENRQAAEVAETSAAQIIEVRKQEAAQIIGQRTADKDRAIGISNQQAEQAIKAEERTTMERAMDVLKVETVRTAEIQKESQIVLAEQEKQTTVIQAEGTLQQQILNAQGIEAEGRAKGAAETAILMAPVDTQIKLAQEIGANKEYQTYLISVRQIEAGEVIGIEQAKAVQHAEIKVIATGGDTMTGLRKAIDLISPKGGVAIGAMLDGLNATESGRTLANALASFTSTKDVVDSPSK